MTTPTSLRLSITTLGVLLVALLFPACDGTSRQTTSVDHDQILARWDRGQAQVAGQPIATGQTVSAGATIHVGSDGPARLSLVDCPGSQLILAAGSEVRLQRQEGANGAPILDIKLTDAGIAQLDLPDKGPYNLVGISGAVSRASVVGTLFVMERTGNKRDFLVVVQGQVKYHLRRTVARALGLPEDDEVLVGGKQGANADQSGGMSAAAAVAGRPSLSGPAEKLQSLAEQAEATRGGWSSDPAADALDALPPITLEDIDLAPPSTDSALADDLAEDLAVTLTDDLQEQLLDEELQNTLFIDEVVDQVVEQGLDALPLPGPPSPPVGN